jgi:hypothetical protein
MVDFNIHQIISANIDDEHTRQSSQINFYSVFNELMTLLIAETTEESLIYRQRANEITALSFTACGLGQKTSKYAIDTDIYGVGTLW